MMMTMILVSHIEAICVRSAGNLDIIVVLEGDSWIERLTS